jgi:DNA-binding NarL/FixJ family response regulator
MSDRIRVLLADDHAVVRKGIREFLEEAGGMGADGGDPKALLQELEQRGLRVLRGHTGDCYDLGSAGALDIHPL